MKFIYLQMKKIPSIREWYLEITSFEDLMLYWMTARLNLDGNAFAEAIKEKKYHCRSELANRLQSLAEINNNSFFSTLQKVSGKTFQTQSKFILNGLSIYINKNGGFFSGITSYKTLKTQEIINNIIFPKNDGKYTDKDIRILKWDGGTHYYAKINDFDVEVNDELKWNTEIEARKKAMEFLKTINE